MYSHTASAGYMWFHRGVRRMTERDAMDNVAQLRSIEELYNSLSPEDKARVNELISRLWQAERLKRQP